MVSVVSRAVRQAVEVLHGRWQADIALASMADILTEAGCPNGMGDVIKVRGAHRSCCAHRAMHAWDAVSTRSSLVAPVAAAVVCDC